MKGVCGMSWFKKLFSSAEAEHPDAEKESSTGEEKVRCHGCGKSFPEDQIRNITVMGMDSGNRFSRLCRKCEEKHPMGI
jgi:hypothetical protein